MPVTEPLRPSGIFELHYSNTTGRVSVVESPASPEMLWTVEQAVRACGAYSQQLKFSDQFKRLLDMLAEWRSSRAEIRAAYLTVRDSGLLFLVVTKDARYDAAFDDELSKLDAEIAGQPEFDLINLHVHSLPNVSEETLGGFLCSTMKLKFPDHASRA